MQTLVMGIACAVCALSLILGLVFFIILLVNICVQFTGLRMRHWREIAKHFAIKFGRVTLVMPRC